MVDSWTPEENAATVSAYLGMLEQELTGQPFVKSEINRCVVASIGRSRGAVERKFQNISAVLRDERCIYIDGYKPLGNYQRALADEVRSQLKARSRLFGYMDEVVDAHAAVRTDLAWDLAEPPAAGLVSFDLYSRAPHLYHTDYPAREAANSELGVAGELAVLEREKGRLIAAGRRDLAEAVSHISLEEGDGAGYDIRSFEDDGRERLIEVKTTRRSISWPMIVSRNEPRVSEERSESYLLARVFKFTAKRVGLYELRGAISATCDLDPLTYAALPKESAA